MKSLYIQRSYQVGFRRRFCIVMYVYAFNTRRLCVFLLFIHQLLFFVIKSIFEPLLAAAV